MPDDHDKEESSTPAAEEPADEGAVGEAAPSGSEPPSTHERPTDPGADAERKSRRPPEGARESERPETYDAAKDELLEALDHFKSAAGFLFGRVAKDVSRETKEIAKDPVVQDAGKVVKRLGREAEPVVREVAHHVRSLSQRLLDLAAPPARGETPPPSEREEQDEDAPKKK